MNQEQLAELFAALIANSADNPHDVKRFTPSVKMGRRYVGIRSGGKWYSVTIEVELADAAN